MNIKKLSKVSDAGLGDVNGALTRLNDLVELPGKSIILRSAYGKVGLSIQKEGTTSHERDLTGLMSKPQLVEAMQNMMTGIFLYKDKR